MAGEDDELHALNLGDHGAAVLNARGDLALETGIESDCQPLNGLIDALLEACPTVRCLRDATRCGVATVLNEFAEAASVAMRIEERALPIREEVKDTSSWASTPCTSPTRASWWRSCPPGRPRLEATRRHSAGREAVAIGEVRDAPEGTVLLNTVFGGARIVDMLVGEQLPRIC
jgi:hydrogenase expression/formation protein HypE